ncbi:MAG: DUF424 family protein [Candidatus Altiarchaeota archaeon]
MADAQDKVKMFYAKVHKRGGEVLIACCDAEILGKRLKSGELEIHIEESFYGGQKVGSDDLKSLMKEATAANLIGDEVVRFALEQGLIEESGVVEVCGTKHAQLYCV